MLDPSPANMLSPARCVLRFSRLCPMLAKPRIAAKMWRYYELAGKTLARMNKGVDARDGYDSQGMSTG